MKEIGKNFNNIFWEMLQKMVTTRLVPIGGGCVRRGIYAGCLGYNPANFQRDFGGLQPDPYSSRIYDYSRFSDNGVAIYHHVLCCH